MIRMEDALAEKKLSALSRRAEQDGLVVSVISQHRFDPASQVVAGPPTPVRSGA